MLPKLIYFDKNVCNAVKNHLFTGSGEYELIKSSIKAGIITIPVSLTVLEEALPIHRSRSKIMFMLEKQVLSELVNWDLIIKYPADLLREEIEAYVSDRRPNPFDNYTLSPDDLFNDDPKHAAAWDKVDVETKKQKQPHWDSLLAIRRKFLDIPRDQRLGPNFPFSRFWEIQVLNTLEQYVAKFGFLKQCKKKGIDGLLNFRAVRLTVGYDLAYYYAKFICEGRMLTSDSLDQHHAALTSAADIFVTNDERLAKILALIPMEKYAVWSYRQFIVIAHGFSETLLSSAPQR